MSITFDQFAAVEMRVGIVREAEAVPKKDRLLRLVVEFGEEKRQIVAGIRESFPDPTVLLGGQFLFVTNLEPRSVGGVESNGMILAVKNADGVVGLLTPTGSSFGGSKAG